ncbi:MAG TPA: glycosyltransferase family A protein [Verrucomicrobiota bacterium]|nr:glycosyltransferase family 2 protein [Verrucomicrobiales bacterium]HRI12700.1 glycosyltransferase family A protein [Verrucomicrobiota bacterium]
MNNHFSYIVITPARNEQDNIVHTIESMVSQSLRPRRWIIVNDGSTDQTATLIDTAARNHPWISAVHRPDRGERKQGGGVVESFYDGFSRVGQEPWHFLVKLDADLSFGPNYFQRCLSKFSQDARLGIGGGDIVREVDGRLVCEAPGDPPFHVRGATKIYRRECWDAIGGVIRNTGWDTADELKANMLGFATYTFKDIPLRHHRATGSADGVWKDSVKNGLGGYTAGYHPLFMLAKCIKRISVPPFFVCSAGLWWGFCQGYLTRAPQIADPALISYVRNQQLNKLLLKPSIW